jgi:hypothetical protein
MACLFFDFSQHGSWSIKYVLPAICSNMVKVYQNLVGVQNGAMAKDAYIAATELGDMNPAKAEISRRLRSYCKLHMWAMVRVWSALTAVELTSLTGDN